MAKEKMYCIDFDDMCDAVMLQDGPQGKVYLVDWLMKWKETTPPLQITLFTIPRRTSDDVVRLFKLSLPWVALAPHGWEHTRGECLAWTKAEAVEKLKAAQSRGIDAPVFRAPGWLLDSEVYEACREIGYTVASHNTFRVPAMQTKEYVYNMHFGAVPPRVKRVHGHLTPVSGNWIYDLDLPRDSKATYLRPWECATVVPSTITPQIFASRGV